MTQSTLTTKGQTTIPLEIRQALGLKPGMRLTYEIEDDHAVLRVHPPLMSAFGALKSRKAKAGFRKARETSTRAWIRENSHKS